MPSLKQLKTRIQSIKSTAQLTKAMQAVAAMRFKKNMAKVSSAKEFSEDLNKFKEQILTYLNPKSPFVTGNPDGRVLSLIVSPTRGFCGGLHRSLSIASHKFLKGLNIDPVDPKQATFITINKPGVKQISRLGGSVLASFNELPKNPDQYDILSVSELIYSAFSQNADFKEVYLTFASLPKGEIVTTKILPLNQEKSNFDEKEDPNDLGRVIDSPLDSLAKEFIHQYLQATINSALLQTYACEEKARMVAMHQATDNAQKINQSLQLSYFRQRQAKITQEMNEIAGGV